MPSIFPPPMPAMSPAVAYGAAGAAVVLGIALLAWGRRIHRLLVAAAGAGAGFAVGWHIGAISHLHLLACGAVGAVTVGILAAVLARLVWGAAVGAVLAAAAGVALLAMNASAVATQPAAQDPPMDDLAAYTQWLIPFAREGLLAVWSARPLAVAGAGLLGLAGLIAGLLLPRAAAVFMTCLIGTVLIGCGAGVGVYQAAPATWVAAWADLRVPGGVLGAILLVGVLYQAVGARRAAKADQEAKEKLEEPAPAAAKPRSPGKN